MDTAYNLAELGVQTLVLDSADRISAHIDDPSRSLSPYTVDRVSKYVQNGMIEYVPNLEVKEVLKINQENKDTKSKYNRKK